MPAPSRPEGASLLRLRPGSPPPPGVRTPDAGAWSSGRPLKRLRTCRSLRKQAEGLDRGKEEVLACRDGDNLLGQGHGSDRGALVERIRSPLVVLAHDRVRSIGGNLGRRWCVWLVWRGGLSAWEVRIVEPAALNELELAIEIGGHRDE